MFAKPRPKKSILPPPSKKRKATHTVEEITFDNSARQEYLTGFHKRKVQRQKHAQEEAAKRAREEKIEFRKQVGPDSLTKVEHGAWTGTDEGHQPHSCEKTGRSRSRNMSRTSRLS